LLPVLAAVWLGSAANYHGEGTEKNQPGDLFVCPGSPPYSQCHIQKFVLLKLRFRRKHHEFLKKQFS
jgi:hypothetical protein